MMRFIGNINTVIAAGTSPSLGNTLNILVVLALILGIIFLIIIPWWKVYKKAGYPGWTTLIPIYSFYILLKIIKKPTWWILITLIPYVGYLAVMVANYHLAKAFGKSSRFGLLIAFLPFIGYPILAYGDARYTLGDQPPAPMSGGPVGPAPPPSMSDPSNLTPPSGPQPVVNPMPPVNSNPGNPSVVEPNSNPPATPTAGTV